MHPVIGFLVLEFRSVVRPQAFDKVLRFGSSFAEAVVGIETSQPVLLFDAGVRLGHPGEVVRKREEVAFSSEAHWVDGSNKVCVHNLVRLLGSSLKLVIVDFRCLSPLAAVTGKILGIIDVGHVQVSEEGF